MNVPAIATEEIIQPPTLAEAAPAAYAGRRGGSAPAAVSLVGRLLALGLGSGCLAVLIVAASLTPNPAGVGSHQGVGLQRCAWLVSGGIPCPSCGYTTSFTWFVRGNLAASVYVQPMGAVLAAGACACVWVGLYVACTGRPVYRLLDVVPGRYYLVPLLAIALLGWAWKIYIRLNGMDGWR